MQVTSRLGRYLRVIIYGADPKEDLDPGRTTEKPPLTCRDTTHDP